MKKLEGKELYRRLQEAKNAKKLHAIAIQKNAVLEQKLVTALELIEVMAKKMEVMQQAIDTQGLLLEEYRRIIFGKKKKKKNEDNDDESEKNDGSSGGGGKRKEREKSSYQRAIPGIITKNTIHEIDCCDECKTKLINKRTVEKYIEDMVLPDEKENPLKTVEKKLIETGWCTKCRKQKSFSAIGGAKVQLGPNLKAMVAYLTVVQRQTYSQIQNYFKDLIQINISDGEIAEILRQQAVRAGPEYARIEKRIATQKGVHADETPWKTSRNAEGNYAWMKTGTETADTIFSLGKSRGIGHARKIISDENPGQVGISDDYCAYDSVFKKHELCWSHPHRKLRDLKDSIVFTGEAKLRCKETFEEFKKLHNDIRNLLKEKTPFEEKKKLKPEFMKRFVTIAQPKASDPKHLHRIKKTLLEKINNYFVCMEIEGIPMDNNKAERGLRPLVIKRKISFGSKTGKGAENLGILFSVLMSLWWKHPPNFFSAYADLLA
jgi:transposase